MNLFGLRPFAFYAVRLLVAFLFLTRSTLWFFIGFLYRSALGVVIPCPPASDMRYAVGSEVDFQPRFDKLHEKYHTKDSARIGRLLYASRFGCRTCSVIGSFFYLSASFCRLVSTFLPFSMPQSLW